MRTRTLLVVLGSAAAVLIAALWWRGGDTSTNAAQAPQARPAAQEPRSEPELLAPTPDPERSAAPPSEPSVVRATVELTPTRATLTGIVLEAGVPVEGANVVVVRGTSDLAQYAVRAEVINVTREVRQQREARIRSGPRTQSDAEGRFSLDISSLFRSGPPAALWIEVRAGGRYTNHYDLPLSPALRDAAPSEFEHEVTLALEPACIILASFALAEVEPARAEHPVAEAPRILLLRVDDDDLRRTGMLSSSVGATGEYQIGVECDLAYVLLAHAPGRRPLGLRVQAVGETRLGRFELERGASVNGRVMCSGAPTRALVTFELEDDSQAVRFVDDQFCERNGVFECGRLSVQTNANGEFRAEGLAAARYKVRVVPADNPSATSDREWKIEVPANNVVFELELGQIDLRVRRAGAPAVGQMISIHHRSPNGNSGGALVTDNDGAALLRLRPDQRTTLELRWREFKGGPEYVRQVDAPFPGVGQRAELVIEL